MIVKVISLDSVSVMVLFPSFRRHEKMNGTEESQGLSFTYYFYVYLYIFIWIFSHIHLQLLFYSLHFVLNL